MYSNLYWITCLIGSHVLGDFLFQPRKLILLKKSFWGKLFHAAIHALLSYLICGQWGLWALPVCIALSHLLIDWIPKENWRLFALDQALHFLMCSVFVLVLPFPTVISLSPVRIGIMKILIMTAGILWLTMATGILIGEIMAEHASRNRLQLAGLANGGLWIGYLERMLILVLILSNIASGIGFLITAKSILRFSGVKDKQKMAEYVLIGTLLSFGLAIVGSLLIQFVLESIQIFQLTKGLAGWHCEGGIKIFYF